MEICLMCDLSFCVWIFLVCNNNSLMASGADFRDLSADFTVVSSRRKFPYFTIFLPKVHN